MHYQLILSGSATLPEWHLNIHTGSHKMAIDYVERILAQPGYVPAQASNATLWEIARGDADDQLVARFTFNVGNVVKVSLS